ncbi:MAG: hypothetical protein JST83_11165 [Bacteroidetes bacterium]|nr:hypothetical protein [Bacteroidota bacterium]
MLKANFKITETGGTGVVQLQSSQDGTTWLDVGTPLSLTNGELQVDDTTNITIDTAIYTPGQLYQFRLTDTAGTPVSNIVSCTIHAISSVTAGESIIDLTDHGGGSFTFDLHAAPSPVQVPAGATLAGYDYEINFWHLLTATPIDSATGMTTDQSIPASGNVDGIYVGQVKYKYPNGTAWTVSRLTKVDALGAVVLDIQINGCTVSDVSGLQLTDQAHIIQTGCSYDVLYAALDNDAPDNNVTMLAGPVPANTPQALTLPAGTDLVLYVLAWDSTISDHFDHDFFPFHSVTIV